MTQENTILIMSRAMLDLQCQSNTSAKPDWLSNPPAYLRAVFIEASEFCEHLGWKWWKKQTPEMAQAIMEIVDISLFYWSDIIISHNGDLDSAAAFIAQKVSEYDPTADNKVIFDGVEYAIEKLDTIRKMELLAGLAVARRCDLTLLLSSMNDLEFYFEDLYKSYIGKSALHAFRMDNGYKDGSYIKIWSGREDNEYLTDIINGNSSFDGSLYSTVLDGLTSDYQKYALLTD